MFRSLTVAAAVIALSTLCASPAFAQAASAPAKAKTTKTSKSTKKKAPAKKAAVAEPTDQPNDNLNPAQLTMADRVLTGLAECELKEKVDIEKLPGHTGNFKLTYDRKSYIMVPEETTTGAIRLVDTAGAVVWVQIPRKSMLMNQKEHQRMVDECQEDEQRIATQSTAAASANAPFVAPSAANTGAAAAAANGSLPVPPTVTMGTATKTTTTETTTEAVVPAKSK